MTGKKKRRLRAPFFLPVISGQADNFFALGDYFQAANPAFQEGGCIFVTLKIELIHISSCKQNKNKKKIAILNFRVII